MSDAAKDHTLGLFTPKQETVEEIQKREKKRDDTNVDTPLVWWASTASQTVSATEIVVRVAQLKNGYRGLQFVRRTDASKSVAKQAALLLHPQEYYTLAQCIFRDSKLIQELCSRPVGDEAVDKIRAFVMDNV